MNVSDLRTSKFLKKEDCDPPILVTIARLTEENVAMEGADPQMKTVINFNEIEKGMVLNSTNGQLIGKITGIEENIETGWIGKKIVLYHDPNITFGGKLVGGIRVRAPKTKVQNNPAQEEPDGF
jgi:hypothetical protein